MSRSLTSLAIATAFLGTAGAKADTAMLQDQPELSSTAARHLLARAIEVSATRGYHLCLAIDDPGGHLLAFDRDATAAPGCADAAMAKARSAAVNGADTQVFLEFARAHNPALGAIPGIIPAVAGVAVHARGKVVGSLGIAGGPSDAEEQRFADELRNQLEQWLG